MFISGDHTTSGFGNNVVVGFDLDADSNTMRVRTTTMDATYQINGRTSGDPICVVDGAGPIYNMKLITMPTLVGISHLDRSEIHMDICPRWCNTTQHMSVLKRRMMVVLGLIITIVSLVGLEWIAQMNIQASHSLVDVMHGTQASRFSSIHREHR